MYKRQAEHSNLVRRALGTGHSVGVLAEGADREETGLLLEQGRVLLERACLLRVTTACVPPEQRDAFEAEGWVCWDETMALAPSESVGPNTFASNTLRRLSGRAYATYLTLPAKRYMNCFSVIMIYDLRFMIYDLSSTHKS